VCDVTVDHVYAQYGALGYSGTDAGGQLVVENSEFDHNVDGFDTNSDNSPTYGPSPQEGGCPNGGVSPITHTHSCWVFIHNYVHDNNNPNVPGSPSGSGSAPVGTGISFDGSRDDTIIDNRIANNGAWGIILTPFPDTESPPPNDSCRGGINAGPATNASSRAERGLSVLRSGHSVSEFAEPSASRACVTRTWSRPHAPPAHRPGDDARSVPGSTAQPVVPRPPARRVTRVAKATGRRALFLGFGLGRRTLSAR
jgi:hypothetical protein